ncbi:MAG TPA: hypothetical protein VKJ07_14225, partial [Mycobacteriales bacterium]|nr:hypothetical protein [Mycobacteriales bacterium]
GNPTPAGCTFPSITFGAGDWWMPATIKVTSNPNAPATDPIQPLKFFPAQLHQVAAAIQGPLYVDGGIGPEDRSVKPAITLPSELDSGPTQIVAGIGDTGAIDTLNVYNDGSVQDDVTTMTAPTAQNPFNSIVVQGMGGNTHFVDDSGTSHDSIGGINYSGFERVSLMLGRGNDQLTINGTMPASTVDGSVGGLTMVYGGGGNNHIVINDHSGGPSSPLAVFGAGQQNGAPYLALSGQPSLNAYAFDNAGNNVIDAHTDTQSVAIYSGPGNDIVFGGSGGDHIAGGSGLDVIRGGAGNDVIYGDDGFNMATQTSCITDPNGSTGLSNNPCNPQSQLPFITQLRELQTVVGPYNSAAPWNGVGFVQNRDCVQWTVAGPTALVTVPACAIAQPVVARDLLTQPPDTEDHMQTAQDLLFGGGGNDVVFGDFGLVTQYAPVGAQGVVENVYTTANINKVQSESDNIGSADTICDGVPGAGNNVCSNTGGSSILVGGPGNDAIDGGAGNDLIFGDNAMLVRTATSDRAADPRFRALAGTLIYDVNPVSATFTKDLVTSTPQADPRWGANGPWWDNFVITVLDLWRQTPGSAYSLPAPVDTPSNYYGDNYIAGGSGDKMIFGGLGNDVIQAHSSIDYRPADASTALTCANPGTVGFQNWVWTGLVGACRDAAQATASTPTPSLQIHESKGDLFGAGADGMAYVEGGGGNNVVFGDFGQNDLVGGNSDLFGQNAQAQRSSGSNIIFGGDGTQISRENCGDGWLDATNACNTTVNGHAHNSDVIVSNNADVFRLVGVNGTAGTFTGVPNAAGFLAFNYDLHGYATATEHIVARAVRPLDNTPGGPDLASGGPDGVQSGPLVIGREATNGVGDVGGTRVAGSAADGIAGGSLQIGSEIHAEGGDAFIYGGPADDTIFGGGQNDTIILGYGDNWVSGGHGDQCIVAGGARCLISRDSSAYGEPLYGVAAIPAANLSQLITTPGNVQQAIINQAGALKYAAILAPYNWDPATYGGAGLSNGSPTYAAGCKQNQLCPHYQPRFGHNIIYGGWGGGVIHGGPGQSAISGTEAPGASHNGVIETGWTNNYNLNGDQLNVAPIETDWVHPFNPGTPMGWVPLAANLHGNAARATQIGKSVYFNPTDPRRKVMLNV